MKKLLLLLTAGFTTMGASAQVNNSIMLNPIQSRYQLEPGMDHIYKRQQPAPKAVDHSALGKTTATFTDWFSFNAASDPGTFIAYNGSTNTGNYGGVTMYTDSNAYVPAGTPAPFYWWCHGLGVSFDPRSLVFTTNFQPPLPITPPFEIDTTKGYWVDSILAVGSYIQMDATQVDTLWIEITYGSDTNSWDLSYRSSNNVTWGITGAPDTTYGFTQALYSPTQNSISSTVPHRVRVMKLLNSTTVNDTIASGWNAWAFPVGIWVPKGRHVVAYAHFEPQTPCAFGTDLATINRWIHDTWDFTVPSASYLQAATGFGQNYDNSTGLMSSSDDRHATTGAYTYMSQPIVTPNYFFTAPVCVHNPYFEFLLRQDIIPPSGVNNVNGMISKTNAYPNPAKGMLNVSFNIATQADVTVTLTNVVGEQVAVQTIPNTNSSRATFNVSTLADGIYMYTVSANGQQSTGRVVVAH